MVATFAVIATLASYLFLASMLSTCSFGVIPNSAVAFADTLTNPVLPSILSTLVYVPPTLAKNATLPLVFVLVMFTNPPTSLISKLPPPPTVKLPDTSTLPLRFDPTATQSVPSYTLMFSTVALASYQSCPLIGLAGAVVKEKFSSRCTKFSLVASP